MTGIKETAKISPKMAKKQPFFDFIKNSPYDSNERNFLQSFYTLSEHPMCNGIKVTLLGCQRHSKNKPKNGHKTAIFRHFSFFAKIIHTIRTNFCTAILQHIMVMCSFCAISSNSYDWDSSESEGKRPKPTPLLICRSG